MNQVERHAENEVTSNERKRDADKMDALVTVRRSGCHGGKKQTRMKNTIPKIINFALHQMLRENLEMTHSLLFTIIVTVKRYLNKFNSCSWISFVSEKCRKHNISSQTI